jgi:hypothetical protein
MCLLNLDLFVCVIILVSMFSLCLYGVCDYQYGSKLTQGTAKVIVPPDSQTKQEMEPFRSTWFSNQIKN